MQCLAGEEQRKFVGWLASSLKTDDDVDERKDQQTQPCSDLQEKRYATVSPAGNEGEEKTEARGSSIGSRRDRRRVETLDYVTQFVRPDAAGGGLPPRRN